MKNISIVQLLIIASLLSLSGCYSTEVSESANVNQSMIHQSYFVEFNAEDNLAKGKAVFRFESWKGNTLSLTPPSTIEVNGQKMNGEKEWLVGFVYRTNRIQADNNTYSFLFTDTENKEYSNSITLSPVEFNEMPESISLSEKTSIKWKKGKVKKGERVELSIITTDTIPQVFSAEMRGSKSITLHPEELGALKPGHANIKLERYYSGVLNEATNAEGEISGIYSSAIRSIQIIE